MGLGYLGRVCSLQVLIVIIIDTLQYIALNLHNFLRTIALLQPFLAATLCHDQPLEILICLQRLLDLFQFLGHLDLVL